MFNIQARRNFLPLLVSVRLTAYLRYSVFPPISSLPSVFISGVFGTQCADVLTYIGILCGEPKFRNWPNIDNIHKHTRDIKTNFAATNRFVCTVKRQVICAHCSAKSPGTGCSKLGYH